MNSGRYHRGDFKPFARLLDQWDLNAQEILSVVQQLTTQWPQLCDGQVARHCQPVWILNGQLRIEADSALWANHIHHNRRQLLERIQQLGFDLIKDIEARVRPTRLTRQTESSAEPVAAKVIQELRKLATGIEDQTLRLALQQLADTVDRNKTPR